MNLRRVCLNWKFIAGVGGIALAVVIVAPKLAWAAVPLLFVLVCPLMMLVMMRGMGSDRKATATMGEHPSSTPGGTREERLTELKARNEALEREIAQLDGEGALQHEPALAASPARTIPRNETDVTA